MIRDFIEVLDIVYQNPQVKVGELLGSDPSSIMPRMPSWKKPPAAALRSLKFNEA